MRERKSAGIGILACVVGFTLALPFIGSAVQHMTAPPMPLTGRWLAEGRQAVAGRTIWFLFRPENCKISTATIAMLNDMAHREGLHVRGVMLSPPDNQQEIELLRSAFDLQFPVEVDMDDAWLELVLREGHRAPILGLVERHRLVAMGGLELTGFVDATVGGHQ